MYDMAAASSTDSRIKAIAAHFQEHLRANPLRK